MRKILGLLLLSTVWMVPARATTLTDADLSTPEGVLQEATHLRDMLQAEVPQARHEDEDDQAWVDRARAVLQGHMPSTPQVVVVVDRNPHVQQLRLIVVDPNGPWYVVGGTKVSTGQPGRFDHYFTPVGVFPHTAAILDYRALGTFNTNHIRGIGLKGMRVWDFGWTPAVKGWTHDGGTTNIRLQMHATDPVLESRLGRQASEGCVRVPAPLNVFMDHHGLLDRDIMKAARTDPGARALLAPMKDPSPLAGEMLVVIDSGA